MPILDSPLRVSDEQFTNVPHHSAKEKAAIVNGTVTALRDGLQWQTFEKRTRAYEFFTQVLSMPAGESITRFGFHHLESPEARREFLLEVRLRIHQVARLTPAECSDVAAMFDRSDDGKDGPYADLLDSLI